MALTNNVTVTGTGLYLSNTFESIFLRSSAAYNPDADPRLPNHDVLTANLTSWANAEISVGNISLYPDPSDVISNSTVQANSLQSNQLWVPVSSIETVTQGAQAISANITFESEVSVARIYSNSSVILRGNIGNAVIAAGETIYFYPKRAFRRSLLTVESNTTAGNILVVPIESVEDIFIGSVVTSANIADNVPLPNLVKVDKIFTSNSTVVVKNVDANVIVASGEYLEFASRPTVGAVRIRQEVIWYEKVWTANSRLTNLTRNVAGTLNSTINGNVRPGNLVSILGLRTVSS